MIFVINSAGTYDGRGSPDNCSINAMLTGRPLDFVSRARVNVNCRNLFDFLQPPITQAARQTVLELLSQYIKSTGRVRIKLNQSDPPNTSPACP